MHTKILFSLLILVLCNPHFATANNEAAELQQALEMLRAQGMPEAQLEQMERQLKGLMEVEQANKAKKAAAAEERRNTAAIRKKSATDYAQRELNPAPGQLQIAIGQELATLTVLDCITQGKREGNLQRVAYVYGAGKFRGAPAVVEIQKSHPHGSPNNLFQELAVHLMSPTDAEAELPLAEVLKNRADAVTAWYNPRAKAIQEKHAVNNDMPLELINQTIEAQSNALAKLQAEADAKRVPRALSHGEISLAGETINYAGKVLTYSGRGRAPDPFVDIASKQVFAAAQCR